MSADRRDDPLPFHRPTVPSGVSAEVADTLASGWLTTGPKTVAFTDRFRHDVDAPDAIALSSCTASLHLALVAAGIGPGDVVFTTPITFAATVAVALEVGARPVLVDVEPDTLNLDPQALEAAIAAEGDSLSGGAVIPVHFAGHPCDMDPICSLAQRHGLAVIEDAAHAFPAAYRGRPVGSVHSAVERHLAAFSFYATKNLAVGEGGMLTGPTELIDDVRVRSLHGMSRDAWRRYSGGGWRYDVDRQGWKCNFTDVQAAIGLHQLDDMAAQQRRRSEIVDRYDAAFSASDLLRPPSRRDEVESALHLYVLRLELERLTIDRDGFIASVTARGIGLSVHFIPIHHLSHFRAQLAPPSVPVADAEFARMVSLPLFPAMTDADVDDVIDVVSHVTEAARR